MFVIGELFNSLAFLVNAICQILYWLLVARIIISWFPVEPYHPVMQFLFQVTEPILAPLRRIPLQVGAMDLTPLIAFMILFFLNRVLVRILVNLAYQFGAGQ